MLNPLEFEAMHRHFRSSWPQVFESLEFTQVYVEASMGNCMSQSLSDQLEDVKSGEYKYQQFLRSRSAKIILASMCNRRSETLERCLP